MAGNNSNDDWEKILQSWCLSDDDDIDDPDVKDNDDPEQSLIKRLERNCQNFYWLNLSNQVRDVSKLTRAIQSNTSVRNVTLYSKALDGMTADEEEDFIHAICRLGNMKSLNVILKSGDCFLEPLRQFRPQSLTRLTLYKLDLSKAHTRRLAVQALSGLSLTDLCLQQFQCEDGNQALMELAQVLHNYSDSLQDLTLHAGYGVRFGDAGLVALAHSLEDCLQLQTLSLETFTVGHTFRAGRALTNLAMKSRRLSEFEFTCGSILDFDHNSMVGFSPQLAREMDHYIKLNRSGIRNLLLHVNVTEEQFLDTVVQERQNLDHIFTLLSQHPVFPMLCAAY